MGQFCSCVCDPNNNAKSVKSKGVDLSRTFAASLKESIGDSTSGILQSYFVMEYNHTEVEKTSDNILCVDLGGSSLKIGIASTRGNHIFIDGEIVSYPIPNNDTELTSKTTIYEWIAEKIKSYHHDKTQQNEQVPRRGALTFSFPLANIKDKVALVKYTKNFNWKRVNLENSPEIPLDQLNRLVSEIVVFGVVINDAMATLLSGVCRDKDTVLGMVLGTGTNGAYFEDLSDTQTNHSDGIAALATAQSPPPYISALNTEWGSFDKAEIEAFRDKYDVMLCNTFKDGDAYMSEKMVGGIYFEQYVNLQFNEKACTLLSEKRGHNPKTNPSTSPKTNFYITNIQMETPETIVQALREQAKGLNETEVKPLSGLLIEIVEEAKERKEYILAGYIAGVLTRAKKSAIKRNKYCICLNGSGCQSGRFQESIRAKVTEILKKQNIGIAPEEIVYFYNDEASLIGAAFALISKLD
ncbi:hexokinase [Nematocida displodere]|uniref:Phosphotransferase n=1 Tax=Nematocida displodere TaxID=1805483 RepID=A0A177EC89_9MICR|nr:hexokinase [Nematocida displodere]